MRQTVIKSYAKLNIGLKVVNHREDGYHNLDMIIVPIELHDTMHLMDMKKAVDHFVTMDDFNITDFDNNVATRAMRLLQEETHFDSKLKLDIHKVIPSKAGLGGGSSNAAFTLKGLNNFLKLNISEEKLLEMAQSLGSDVPFFIPCKPMRCQGTGNIFTPISIKNDYYVLIVKPDAGCKTVDIFNKYDSMNIQSDSIDNIIKALETGDDDLLATSLFNDLEAPAFEYLPEIKVIKDKMLSLGLKKVCMTGSGSCVYALSTNKSQIKKAAKEFYKNYKTIVTKIIK